MRLFLKFVRAISAPISGTLVQLSHLQRIYINGALAEASCGNEYSKYSFETWSVQCLSSQISSQLTGGCVQWPNVNR